MKTLCVILGMLVFSSSAGMAQQTPIVIENAYLRYTISADGRNLAFVDRTAGVDYLNTLRLQLDPRTASWPSSSAR
jgi:hypothetical protein